MAALGGVVSYKMTADDVKKAEMRAHLRSTVGGRITSAGVYPVVGDTLAAIVSKHYGGAPGSEVADLLVQINCEGGLLWLGNVQQGAAGTAGRWW
jgi:hypothetical protein